MNVRQRMMAVRLAGKIEKNQEYAKKLGIEIVNAKKFADFSVESEQNCALGYSNRQFIKEL